MYALPRSAPISRAYVESRNSDRAPELLTEPTSSKFERYAIAVCFGVPFTSITARAAQYDDSRSSWPYAPTRPRSMPTSAGGADGTSDSSADTKSSSRTPYCEVSAWITAAVTDASWPPIEPATGSSSSPEKTSSALRLRMLSLSECGALSGMTKTGSPSFNPIATSTRLPSVVSIRPISASGRFAHWYFLMPP